jgi:ATP-dependent DNA helicase RecQ
VTTLAQPDPAPVSTSLPAWPAWLQACSIDIESNPAQDDRIFRLAALRGDRDACVDLHVLRTRSDEVRQRLDEVAAGARFLVGHNLSRHDLPLLAQQYPGLQCLNLPLIDTLELSALAFPRNPYHRLVKGYKLVSEARSEPLLDARLALELLADEIQAFEALHATDPAWCGTLHALLQQDSALDALFTRIRGASAPEAAAVRAAVHGGFADLCCGTRLQRLGDEELAGDVGLRWPIAYALSWLRVAGGN